MLGEATALGEALGPELWSTESLWRSRQGGAGGRGRADAAGLGDSVCTGLCSCVPVCLLRGVRMVFSALGVVFARACV